MVIYRKLACFLIILLCVLAPLRLNTTAQIKPVYDQGALGLAQLLKRIDTSASVMMIGAHPDDEDTALLAYLARGKGARTAYLSLTRGDGGQNIIGRELGEALGVIRTEELLQARRLDGAEQYFARAYDFGFSKTLEEAKQKWNENIILCDVVRTIRQFRPFVVVSLYTGTPADSHGQHQFAGYITPIAVEAAADIGKCPEAGAPWKVKKLYVRHLPRSEGEPRLRVNTGEYDPLLGRSYFEVAMEARSQHKSQEQGVLELKGPQNSGLNLIGSGTTETGIFDGLGDSISSFADNVDNSEAPFREKLSRIQDISNRILQEYNFRAPEKIVPLLVQGLKLAQETEWSTRRPESNAFMRDKRQEFVEAIRAAAGIQIDALADRETVVPGEEFTITVKVFTANPKNALVKKVELTAPTGWAVQKTEVKLELARGFTRVETPHHAAQFLVKAASDAEPTQPYWLRRPRKNDLFEWDKANYETLPFQNPLLNVDITVEIAGTEAVFQRPVEYRYADDIRGEVRRKISVVPKLSLELDKNLLIVRQSDKQQRDVAVSITNHTAGHVNGSMKLNVPSGWNVEPKNIDLRLNRKGEKAAVKFLVTMPSNVPEGSYRISAEAAVNSERFTTSMRTIAYPHIQTHRLYYPASAKINVIDLKVEPVKIGYIQGSGDRVADAIRETGLDVEMLDEADLISSDLSRFDVIVVGIRASQVRPDLVANNQRLLDFARHGGTLIVQYQLPMYAQQNLTPYPAQLGPRVADENAPVTILQPNHPILNFPNKITQKDFEGWVQERNLYSFSTMDERYLALLEVHDAGEAENKGGLVVADIGKGKYIYCSYSLFRQLPAGVPGAYRLLANMLNFGKAKK